MSRRELAARNEAIMNESQRATSARALSDTLESVLRGFDMSAVQSLAPTSGASSQHPSATPSSQIAFLQPLPHSNNHPTASPGGHPDLHAFSLLFSRSLTQLNAESEAQAREQNRTIPYRKTASLSSTLNCVSVPRSPINIPQLPQSVVVLRYIDTRPASRGRSVRAV